MVMLPDPVRRRPSPSRSVGARRRVVVLLGAAVALAASAVSSPSIASGQALDPTPAAGPVPALFAAVTPDPLDPPPIQVTGVWIAEETVVAGAGVVAVNVVFGAGFEIPREPWRVSVSVGDPRGGRVRASLVSVGSAGLSGRVERGDGVQWDDAGPTGVTASGDGLVTIDVPVDAAPEGTVVWVEAEATVDSEIVVSRTPTFALEDLLGQRSGPSLGTSPFAAVADDRGAQPVVVDGPGPTVQIVDGTLAVTTTDAAPAEVDGIAVVDVIDTVTITDAGSEQASRLEIDRRTGEVRLATDGAEAFVAVPGTTPWLVDPPSATDPALPATVTFDLEALSQAVGGPAFDRSSTRVGVRRTLALDDRRILDAAGVGGTLGWFDESLTAPPPAVLPATVEGGTPFPTFAVAALVVLVGAVAVVVLVRRRRVDEPRPIERLDPAPAPVAAGVVSFVASSEPRPVGAEPTPAPLTVEAASTAMPATPPETSGSVDPLAALLAEVDELSDRVDRLGSLDDPDPDPGPDPTSPAAEGDERPR